MNTPAEIAQNYVNIGKGKVETPAVKLFILGIMAGLFIGIGAVAYYLAIATIGGGLGKLVGACFFPVGLLLVLVAGSELFTGNCLLVIPALEKAVPFTGVLKNWLFVYLGNFVGSTLLSFLYVFGHSPSLLDGAVLDAVMSVAEGKVALSFSDAFIRGILCNIIVCLAVWVSFAGKTVASKVAAIYLPVMVFVLAGFEHSVANMTYIMTGVFANAVYGVGSSSVNLASGILNNLLPVTLGNIVGGAAVGVTYWYIYLHKKK